MRKQSSLSHSCLMTSERSAINRGVGAKQKTTPLLFGNTISKVPTASCSLRIAEEGGFRPNKKKTLSVIDDSEKAVEGGWHPKIRLVDMAALDTCNEAQRSAISGRVSEIPSAKCRPPCTVFALRKRVASAPTRRRLSRSLMILERQSKVVGLPKYVSSTWQLWTRAPARRDHQKPYH